MNHYNVLEQEFNEIYKINSVINLLYWDIDVNIPIKSLEHRTEEITLLDSIVRSKIKSTALQERITAATANVSILNSWQQANLREIKRIVLDTLCIDDSLNKRYIEAGAKCELVWRSARKENDYNKLLPYLQDVFSCVQEIAKNRASAFKCSNYDALVDIYDPEIKSKDTKKTFDELKKSLPDLIWQIVEKQKSEKILPLERMKMQDQKDIGKRIMYLMGFDFDRGRLDESSHPFANNINFDDIRITTRYNENDFLSGIYGIIHETGHALYEQHLPMAYAKQPVGRPKSMAIHESQSLFMEMQVGKSNAFCEFLSKLLYDEFNLKSPEYSGNNLYRLLNSVTPSCIRVEADEVTYPMHVILRFEIEELLINGDITLKDLPKVWNDKMQEYLGVTPKDYSCGCMQDIHWHRGTFGYFPVYLRGAIIASQLMSALKVINKNIMQEINAGNFSNVHKFLIDNVHSQGSLKSTRELLNDAVGVNDISSDTFINYIRAKYI